jgi:hypothetical protein
MTLTKKEEDIEKHQPEAVGVYPKSAISWYNKGSTRFGQKRRSHGCIRKSY